MKFIYVCICLYVFISRSRAANSGPFNVVILDVKKCDDVGTHELSFQNMTLTKTKKAPLLSATVVLKRQLSDKLKVTLSIGIKNHGEWKLDFKHEIGGLCTSMKLLAPNMFDNFLRSIGQKTCPVKQGVYKMENLAVHMDLKISYARFGRRRIDLIFSAKQRVGCLRIISDFVPKKLLK